MEVVSSAAEAAASEPPAPAHVEDNSNNPAVDTDAWVRDIVGRDWEVYWKPSSSSIRRSNSNNSLYEDDWYDAVPISFLGQRPASVSGEANQHNQAHASSNSETNTGQYIFSVSFVGEDDMLHEMALYPSIWRPRSHHQTKNDDKMDTSPEGEIPPSSKPKSGSGVSVTPSLEWAHSIVGKECEVFWKQTSTQQRVKKEEEEGTSKKQKTEPKQEGTNETHQADNSNATTKSALVSAAVEASGDNNNNSSLTNPKNAVKPICSASSCGGEVDQSLITTIQVIPIELKEPGRIGITVQTSSKVNGTATVASVVENTQAARAGLLQGDVLCYRGSNGTRELLYDTFLDMARSPQRPICFEVRRLVKTTQAGATGDAMDTTSPDAAAAVKTEDTPTDSDNKGGEDSGDEHEPDWYDARVQSLDEQQQKEGRLVFQLTFEGDENVYDMQLKPELVRPSARAWIRRTKALLLGPATTQKAPSKLDKWVENLPHDTSTLCDEPELSRIREQVETSDFCPLPQQLPSLGRQRQQGLSAVPSRKDYNAVVRLVLLIRSQLYLRTKLTPVDKDHLGKGEDEPAEVYVDYLVKCLRELDECCQWYYACWKLHVQLLGDNNDNSDNDTSVRLFQRTDILEDPLRGGLNVMSTLISMDASSAGCKRKRKASRSTGLQSLMAGGSTNQTARQRKRRRKTNEFADFWTTDESSGERVFNAEVTPEDFLSVDLVQRLVDKTNEVDVRWYTRTLGAMLLSLSRNIVAPLIRWERRAEFYLGDKDCVDVEASDGETSEEDMDDDEDGVDYSSSKTGDEKRSTQSVKVEEIQSLIESADHGPVLRRIHLKNLVVRLQEKLSFIESFEEKVWRLLDSVLEEKGASLDKGKDLTYVGLTDVLAETREEDSPLKNVDPLGKCLTRKVIANALIYREWLLDLIYCEAQRERLAFVENLVSRLSKLPPLSSRSDGGSNDTNTIMQKLDQITPRVQSLSAKYIDHVAQFNRVQSLLGNRSVPRSGREGLMLEQGVRDAIEEIKQTGVVSLSEEMLSVRLDVLLWEERASTILKTKKPAFADLSTLYETLETILEGKSSFRADLTRALRPNAEVDAEVREFARGDVESMLESLGMQTRSLFSNSSMWKQRADSILSVLRGFGNDQAGDAGSVQKSPSMVDVRRIEDLISEYDDLEVDLSDIHLILRKIRDEATLWADSVTKELSYQQDKTSETYLSDLQRIKPTRPKGIIIDPSRQVVDMVEELLGWHIEVGTSIRDAPIDRNHILFLLAQGIEVVRLYAENSEKVHFAVPSDAFDFLSSLLAVKKPFKVLSRSKLDAAQFSRTVVGYLASDAHDDRESHPLFVMLFWLWQLYVQRFVGLVTLPTTPESDRSLMRAKELFASKPQLVAASNLPSIVEIPFPHVNTLSELIKDGDGTETVAREALTEAKNLLRSFSGKHDQVRQHPVKLKELIANFKTRSQECRGTVLDKTMELLLERYLKVFAWLVRTLQYPMLQLNETTDSVQQVLDGEDPRIPWEVLVSLFDRLPSSEQESGEFACVLLRVKELYETAYQWQQEISSFTQLSLRGGKRRSSNTQTPEKAEGGDSTEKPTVVALAKVAELCQHPILQKVAMPRERGTQQMLERTREFEARLHAFLGKDYDGSSPDKAAYPETGSLVGSDGSFLLLRLTGSPMFQSLKSAITSISEIADDVFADTPGKAAFDWIRSSVRWIESLHASITTAAPSLGGPQGLNRLVLGKEAANRLLKEGEDILFNFPEDLRSTLSQHKIYVSANKDGKLTVKSRKGGSHHAVGVVAIRWCPFLFDSLKADVARLDSWEKAIKEMSTDFIAFSRETAAANGNNNAETIVRYYQFRDILTDLLVEAEELVVSPSSAYIDPSKTLLLNIQSKVMQSSTPSIAASFAKTKYRVGATVVNDRFKLLDALASRQALAGENQSADEMNLESREGHFRNAARTLLVNALRKAMKNLAVVDENDVACSMKAWEIENALFDEFQGELGESKISNEYRDKARALRRCIEDVDQLALCARVLGNAITAKALVKMPSEELANPRTKQRRATAEARLNRDLTGLSPKWQVSTPSPLKVKPPPPKAVPATVPPKSSPRASPKSSPMASPETEKPVIKLKSHNLGELVSKAARSSRPPPLPPPSLATMSNSRTGSTLLSSSGNLVTNDAGGNRFRISISNSSRQFMAGFYPERDAESLSSDVLPERLSDKGKVEVKTFAKFIRDKLKSRKWVVASLRMTVFSDKDGREYKKFYKDYEKRGRIAMFQINKTEKLYLVTPLFHRNLEDYIPFENSASTYGVVLVRKDR